MRAEQNEIVEGFGWIGRRTPTVADLRLTSPDRPLSIAEQIADRLADGIIRNEIHEGSWLREVSLAERFTVSRAPIREAFRLLESDDLLELHANRGAMVSRLSRSDIWQVGFISEALVEPSVRVLVEGWSESVRDAYLQAAIRIAAGAGESDGATMALNMAIHSLWCNRAGVGPKLERITRMMFRQTLRYTAAGLLEKQDRMQAAEAIRAFATAGANGDSTRSAAIYLDISREMHRRGWERHIAERAEATAKVKRVSKKAKASAAA
ncbi:GntR family transcriptional regulator [Novosphingobium sp. B 225]|uniref:GntR family transcriptional regulator n=1 Tax=Novosphingobium sp. B 225 TaxID=1961849 RepID=UPI000B4B0CDD|nr:GntR family transcriptional regulator [Novosphingobium sp. B 225]